MNEKIPIQNRAFAFILSPLFAITLILSMFALPVELVMFNKQTFSPILEKDENLSRYSEVISRVLVSELNKGFPSAELPKFFSFRDGLQTAFEKNISPEESLSVITEISNQTLDYLNFQTPNFSLILDIGQLKSNLILNSEQIASDYLSTLTRCSALINENIAANQEALDLEQLPPCKPSDKLVRSFIFPTSEFIEDLINHFPEKVSLTRVIPFDRASADKYFYFYSLGRWALRLLPIIAIGLLILIALLLKAEKKVMLKWIGRLLVFTTGFGLIGLVVILIGFDQFVVLLANRHLNNFIEGFGILLLGLIQEVGYLTLVWVIISFAGVFAFGMFLLLVNRFIKSKVISQQALTYEDEGTPLEVPASEIISEEIPNQKEIKPETMEEIEERENKSSKKKNNKNSST